MEINKCAVMANEYYTNVSGATTCSSSRWLTEEVFKLIDMVQRDEAIYNPRHKYYFCRPYVENFWREVDQKLEKNPGASLAKWTNLRISFRREYTNYLEEKVPPCWSYFDRMFFLHPYLRKKQPQPKSIDSQVQDALVCISSLSDRIQRAASMSNGGGAGGAASAGVAHVNLQSQAPQHQQQLDHYLEYFDDPEQNNSELDDMMEEEHQSRFQNAEHHSLNNDIKSECDDHVDDYEPETGRNRHDEHDHDHDHEHDDNDDGDDTEMRSFMLDTLASSSSSVNAHALQERRNQLRVKHMNRLQTRSYHEELRLPKRPRSQESISSTQMGNGSGGLSGGGSAVAVSGHPRMLCHTSTTPTHTNVSFVRPTLAKPVEMVSTTTNSNGVSGNGIGGSNSHPSTHSNDVELSASSTSGQQAMAASSSMHQHPHQHQHPRHASSSHHAHHGGSHHRLEIAAITSGAGGTGNVGGVAIGAANAMISASTSTAPTGTAHLELCDCKTDPDAMFLMSLLPDIQKLNGRDRGKIKIAFQNILQDYLYPD